MQAVGFGGGQWGFGDCDSHIGAAFEQQIHRATLRNHEQSVALLVGGIGVMAVMMISVTDRTREIGIRKAVGATRRDILQQFLIEAAALTGTGGVIGIVIGLVLGRVASLAMNIHAATPIEITLAAVIVSVGIGLVFGVLPARRAARLDPIESLRYE